MAKKTTERGICELYQEDPERADFLVFGRKADKNRRGFLKGAGLAAMGAAVGGLIPFHRNMPAGVIPAALADDLSNFKIEGKDGLVVFADKPINAETPAHLLDDDVTPAARHFVRNNGGVPQIDVNTWTLTVDGHVERPLKLSLEDLKTKFKPVKLKLQIECAGNGRAGFNPPTSGNQWTVGAIGNAEWTGVRYRDILKAAGVKSNVVYTGHYGADPHLSGDPSKTPISRGVPIDKAMEEHSLIAYEMNGAPIPLVNGFPVRAICPGWAGSTSQKWLTRIQLRDIVHDGEKMTGQSYKMPKYNVAPGAKVPDADFQIIGSMPVKSIITTHQSGSTVNTRKLRVGGHAWAGDRSVKRMHVSVDFGVTWVRADLRNAPNKYSWQRWYADLEFPQAGYYEIWARATDDHGYAQPFAVNWNPRGYLNNVMHRIALNVA